MRSYTPKFKKYVIDLYNGGQKGSKIFEILGVPPSTIYSWVNRHEYSINKQASIKKEETPVESSSIIPTDMQQSIHSDPPLKEDTQCTTIGDDILVALKQGLHNAEVEMDVLKRAVEILSRRKN